MKNSVSAIRSALVRVKAKSSTIVAGVAAVATLGVSSGAHAITAPAAGSFAYDMYDIGVNQILKGAPGFVGGTAGIIYSATLLNKNWIAAALGILGCSAVLKADAITTSLGLLM